MKEEGGRKGQLGVKGEGCALSWAQREVVLRHVFFPALGKNAEFSPHDTFSLHFRRAALGPVRAFWAHG